MLNRNIQCCYIVLCKGMELGWNWILNYCFVSSVFLLLLWLQVSMRDESEYFDPPFCLYSQLGVESDSSSNIALQIQIPQKTRAKLLYCSCLILFKMMVWHINGCFSSICLSQNCSDTNISIRCQYIFSIGPDSANLYWCISTKSTKCCLWIIF